MSGLTGKPVVDPNFKPLNEVITLIMPSDYASGLIRYMYAEVPELFVHSEPYNMHRGETFQNYLNCFADEAMIEDEFRNISRRYTADRGTFGFYLKVTFSVYVSMYVDLRIYMHNKIRDFDHSGYVCTEFGTLTPMYQYFMEFERDFAQEMHKAVDLEAEAKQMKPSKLNS